MLFISALVAHYKIEYFFIILYKFFRQLRGANETMFKIKNKYHRLQTIDNFLQSFTTYEYILLVD